MKLSFLLSLLGCIAVQGTRDCIPRQFEYDSVVCVCNAMYCDEIGEVPFPEEGSYTVVTTSRDGLRFNIETRTSERQPTSNHIVKINHYLAYQTIIGYGGALTDSAGMNIVSLSEDAQDKLLRSYFAPEGIEYNLCRIPIAGTDFSLRTYSYDDVEGDVELIEFDLADEDFKYKLPLILKAQSLSQKVIKHFGSPWSPPAWMKTNGTFDGEGELLKDMWDPYSNYLVKFVQSYEDAGVPMWGLTTQNQPLTGFDPIFTWNKCGWLAEDMRDWIKGSLGPILEAAGMRRLALMSFDSSRNELSSYAKVALEDPAAAQYVDGTAIHWYEDASTSPAVLDELQDSFQDKFILYTEACEELSLGVTGPVSVPLGKWSRAENYAHSILETSNHFSSGWVDWNMALDMDGGPNWAGNQADAPIIINAEADEFYKQPSYYAMGHFSKFVAEGAVRLHSSVEGSDLLESVAFHDPSGATVIVLLNKAEEALDISITDFSESYLNLQIPAKALQTILWT